MTTARVSVEADRRKRMRNYLLAMGFRVVAFPLSVWMLVTGWVVPGVALAVAATIIPSIAVVVANAVDRRGMSTTMVAPEPGQARLGPGSAGPAHQEEPDEEDGPHPAEDIPGTVVSSRDTPYPQGPRPDRGVDGQGPAPTDGDTHREAS